MSIWQIENVVVSGYAKYKNPSLKLRDVYIFAIFDTLWATGSESWFTFSARAWNVQLAWTIQTGNLNMVKNLILNCFSDASQTRAISQLKFMKRNANEIVFRYAVLDTLLLRSHFALSRYSVKFEWSPHVDNESKPSAVASIPSVAYFTYSPTHPSVTNDSMRGIICHGYKHGSTNYIFLAFILTLEA